VRPVLLITHAVMALWLLVAAALRLVLSLASGVPIDSLPFISGALGLLGLAVVLPKALEARRAGRDRTVDEAERIRRELEDRSRPE
jgi:hypothetical protein